MRKHRKLHEGEREKYECPKCPKKYANYVNLKMHYLAVHEGIRYPCTYEGCSREFTNEKTMREHVRGDHEGNYPFRCEICDRGFFQSSFHTAHMNSHYGIKAFECGLCGSKYAHSSDLNRHLLTCGEEETPHPCPQCGKVFKSERRMKEHKRYVHDGRVKKYLCNLCGKVCLQRSRYLAHMAKYHQEDSKAEVQFILDGTTIMQGATVVEGGTIIEGGTVVEAGTLRRRHGSGSRDTNRRRYINGRSHNTGRSYNIGRNYINIAVMHLNISK